MVFMTHILHTEDVLSKDHSFKFAAGFVVVIDFYSITELIPNTVTVVIRVIRRLHQQIQLLLPVLTAKKSFRYFGYFPPIHASTDDGMRYTGAKRPNEEDYLADLVRKKKSAFWGERDSLNGDAAFLSA